MFNLLQQDILHFFLFVHDWHIIVSWVGRTSPILKSPFSKPVISCMNCMYWKSPRMNMDTYQVWCRQAYHFFFCLWVRLWSLRSLWHSQKKNGWMVIAQFLSDIRDSGRWWTNSFSLTQQKVLVGNLISFPSLPLGGTKVGSWEDVVRFDVPPFEKTLWHISDKPPWKSRRMKSCVRILNRQLMAWYLQIVCQILKCSFSPGISQSLARVGFWFEALQHS